MRPRGVNESLRRHIQRLSWPSTRNIYRRYRDDAAWTPFSIEMESLCYYFPGQEPALPWTSRYANRFLRIGHLASLTFCNGWNEAP